MPSGGWVAEQCAWNGPTSGFFLSVGTTTSIMSFADPAAPNATVMLVQFTAQAGTSTPKTESGIGDGAALTATGIAAYAGGTYVQVTNLGLTEVQLIEIAKLVVAQL
jgi:hypothetical protein